MLSSRDLPEAELCAALLDGELYRLGPGFCVMDEIDDSVRRALSLASALSPRLIAEQRTALWVLGLIERMPHPVQLCTRADARSRPSALSGTLSGALVREVVINDDELRTIHGLLLTSPLRTALDLARFSPQFGEEEQAMVRGLAAVERSPSGDLPGFTLTDCTQALAQRRNLPRKRRAIERLTVSLR